MERKTLEIDGLVADLSRCFATETTHNKMDESNIDMKCVFISAGNMYLVSITKTIENMFNK